jgi:hypothetical protein
MSLVRRFDSPKLHKFERDLKDLKEREKDFGGRKIENNVEEGHEINI